MPITFATQEHALTLPSPAPGSEHVRRKRQAAGRTASGALVVYEKGDDLREVALAFESLDDAARDALDEFFSIATRGCAESFTFTDSEGRAFIARFAEPQLRFMKIAKNVWDVAFSLEIEDEPE